MSRNLVFITRSCDSQILNEYKRKYNFFIDENDDTAFSHIDTFDEKGALKWFFETFHINDLLFEALWLDKEEYQVFLEVEEPITNSNQKPGDIDVLLRNKKNPKHTIAIECKKIKAVIDDDGYETINGIDKAAKKGVLQVNALTGMGFYQSYLMLIFLTDGRRKVWSNQMCRGLSGKEMTRIYSLSEFSRRNENSGIILLEIVQNTYNSHS